MGGIDTSDAALYLEERRTAKYWQKVYINIFSRMVLNSYIICKVNIPAGSKPVSRLACAIKIVDTVSEE
jgi:hypothetical protein